ncbi:IclR family transcriptional regulator [Pseudoglutamicibacter albus]|uniref:IclR family transcriptional regulator n=1 Tax=Pseudoglutamicibacter albus TaxID=98671 RepID=UPI001EF45F91|nr:IclR family transcriptional regulator [Pseudoglutamicibacter albus]MCG7303818.1 IclR family transcriptional regulator [Pseudoglutamicibacter albus]
MTAPESAPKSVTGRILSILTLFESGQRSISLTDIATRTGLPLSTVHRLVGELVEWRFLAKNETGRYQLGIRLWALAQNTGRQLRDAAKPLLQDLFSLTGETTHLAIREGNEALYIERLYSTKRLARAAKVGGSLPLHATAVGKCILAFEEDWVRDAYLQLPLKAFTPFTEVNPHRLAAQLAKFHKQGYATAHEEVTIGSSSIAVPIFHTGRLGGALGLVVYSSQAPDMTKYLPAMQAISRKIEKATEFIPLESLHDAHKEPLPESGNMQG